MRKIYDKNNVEYNLLGMDDFAFDTFVSLYVKDLNNEQIGLFTFECHFDYDGEIECVVPYNCDISTGYRRKGIGVEIIKTVANEYKVKFSNMVNNIVDDKNDVHYSDEGHSFAQYCVDHIENVYDDSEVADSYEDDY